MSSIEQIVVQFLRGLRQLKNKAVYFHSLWHSPVLSSTLPPEPNGCSQRAVGNPFPYQRPRRGESVAKVQSVTRRALALVELVTVSIPSRALSL